MTSPIHDLAFRLAVAIAVVTAVLSLALQHADPAARSETLFLAAVAAAVLVPTSALAGSTASWVGGVGFAVVALAWIPAVGVARSYSILLVLLLGLAVATFRTFQTGRLRSLSLAAAFVGAQVLLRPELLLVLGVETLSGLLVLPVVSALAVRRIARHTSIQVSLVCAAALAVWSRGLDPSSLAVLAGFSGATCLRANDRSEGYAWLVLPLVLSLLGLVRPEEVVLLLAGVAVFLFLAAPWLGVVLGGLAVALVFALDANLLSSLLSAGWLLVLLPAALSVRERGKRARVIAAFGLALAAAVWAPGVHVLLVPILLVGLSLDHRATARLQWGWSAALLLLCCAASTYPWLRPEPLTSLSAADRFVTGGLLIGSLAVTLGLAIAFARAFQRHHVLAAIALGVALSIWSIYVPQVRQLLGRDVLVLDMRNTSASLQVAGTRPARTLTIDTFLSNSLEIEAGRPVLAVELVAADGSRHAHSLRNGSETGEWAAIRPDVASHPTFQAPDPWLSWVPRQGGFFAQRYRASWSFEVTPPITEIVVMRPPDLPPRTEIAVFQIALGE